MKYKFGKLIVVTLGGSILYPQEIDAGYISLFRKFILSFKKENLKFVIVIGGGKAARLYQNAASAILPISNEDKDWIGIHATRLNAHLLRTIFRDVADPVVIDSQYKIKKLTHPVTIASGWRPGWSTDYVAAALAVNLKAGEYVVAGKPAYVYDKDPQKWGGANKFETISWKNYRKMIPAKWIPGSHAPIDPVAAKLSEARTLKAIVINGKDLRNFKALLKGREFKGTIVG